MRRTLLVAGLVVALALMAGPVSAGTQQAPEITDPCGVESLAPHPTDGATVPWTDICSGWFSTVDSPSGGLKVTLAFAGTINDDRFGFYRALWRTSNCRYEVTHDVGLGTYRSNGVVVADPGGDWIHVRCGTPVEHACGPTPLSVCTTYPDERSYRLPEAATVNGNQLSWTLRFEGALAPLATDLQPGTTLTNGGATASTKVFLAGVHPSYCFGTTCGGIGGDDAVRGKPYTIGD